MRKPPSKRRLPLTYRHGNPPTAQRTTASTDALDPFDPQRYLLHYDPEAGRVKHLLQNVEVRRPTRHEFIRVHPSSDYRFSPDVIFWREGPGHEETYLLEPALAETVRAEFPAEVRRVEVLTAINSHGTVFLWPVKLPKHDGAANDWHRTAVEGSQHAQQHWIRLAANQGRGAYDVAIAQGKLAEPEWPDVSFRDLLEAGFKNLLIDTFDHPVLKKLRGEL